MHFSSHSILKNDREGKSKEQHCAKSWTDVMFMMYCNKCNNTSG